MLKRYKFILYLIFVLLIYSSVFCLISKSLASSNPYGEKGFDLKEGLKGKNISPIDKKDIKQVQLEADQVEFSQDNNIATAKGNVVVTSQKNYLYADHLELQRAIGEAIASGHVYLSTPQMKVDADNIQYNFNDSTGKFENARVFNDPFQIKGQTITKVSENHMVMERGYLSTCDHDKPHFRLGMKKLDFYQNDRAIARGVTMYLGKVPVMYFPRYTQNLKEHPIFTIIPGYKKDFGAFALSTLRLKINSNLKVIVHGDFRERYGLAEGVDVKYTTPSFGSGLIRTYYTHERAIASKHLWNMYNSDGTKKGPTIRHERYKIQWRHQWRIDKDTDVIWQYYKIHDYDLGNMGFIKRYFEREYRSGADVTNYFQLTRNLPKGTISFRKDLSRVNPAIRGVEKIPEIQYVLSGQQLGESNFYLDSKETYSNIQYFPSNQGPHMKTQRLDFDNSVAYPFRVSIFQLRPFVGGEHTYYSRTNNTELNNVIRGQFKSGSDITTHFYRVWNYKGKIAGVEINKLRHVITPTVSYSYNHRPTINDSHFNQFDSIDTRDLVNNVHFALENKLQTKRNNASVDLLRFLVESDYSLIRSVKNPAFRTITSKLEFSPNDWLRFTSDSSYDNHERHWNTFDFDVTVHDSDKWSVGLGKRYARDFNDQLTTEIMYKINPKWKFKIADQFYLDTGEIKQQDYILTRDLHEWEVDMQYHHELRGGHGFFLLFRLKAFPDIGLNLFSETFHAPKAGSQSTSNNL